MKQRQFIEETGNKYGRLTVLGFAGIHPRRGQAMWLCKCICGNTTTVNGSYLRNGARTRCGRACELDDKTGNKYGRLVVLERVSNNKHGKERWLCGCDCGNVKIVDGSALLSGGTKSCGCLVPESHRLPKGLAAMRRISKGRKQDAKRRGFVWEIDEFQLIHLTQELCFYCGAEPNNFSEHSSHYGGYYYNGLDRVDNTKGYTVNNVVACCRRCNIMKNATEEEEWYRHMSKILKCRKIRRDARK